MRLDKDEYDELLKWCRVYEITDKNGPTPGTLAKKLFRAAMPLFESCEFDDREVRRAIARTPLMAKKGNQVR